METIRFILVILGMLGLLSACALAAVTPTPTPRPPEFSQPAAVKSPTPAPRATSAEDAYAFAQNQRLGRGVNLGNALEAPTEGEWGMVIQEEYFQLIKQAGFDAVRVPIKWSAHTAADAPYTIDPQFFERIDWVIAQAQKNELAVVINIHHYDEIMEDPMGHKARFLAIWEQIAERYQDYPDSLYFELLNEPNSTLSNTSWNDFAREAIAVIRKTNRQRIIIVGPGNWNSIDLLPLLDLPAQDRNLIVTVHYYLPFHFTHQGAEWAEGSEAWMGTTWDGIDVQKRILAGDLGKAAQWGAEQSRPIYLGEFGAYSKADMASRQRWTAFVARSAEQRGFSWAYWEFGAGFGVYDREAKDWVEPIRQALLP